MRYQQSQTISTINTYKYLKLHSDDQIQLIEKQLLVLGWYQRIMRGRVASFASSSGVVTGRTQAAMSLQAQAQAHQAQQQEIEQIKSAHETLT